jgi:hypothetical protein
VYLLRMADAMVDDEASRHGGRSGGGGEGRQARNCRGVGLPAGFSLR